MVKFIDEDDRHDYLNENDEKYISSTTIVHKYVKPFNKLFWSHWSALKEIDKYFDSNKGKYMQRKNKPLELLLAIVPDYIDKDVLDLTVKKILIQWDEKNAKSKIKGTKIHLEKELSALGKIKEDFAGIKYQVNQKSNFNFRDFDKLSYYDLLPDGFHSELLLWNHELKIAGMSDIVIIETDKFGDRWISIGDYKSNLKIEWENKYDKMLYPLDKYSDCNGNHYTLQLSLYAYLLELMGFKVKHLRLIWINELGDEIPYVLNYKKQDVINMIEHYNNNK
jgi:hypothetical protein